MNFKATQMQLLAALGACFAALMVAGPAAARPHDDGGSSNRPALEGGSVTWYLTDEYRPFMLPESEANAIVNQRQLELATDRQFAAEGNAVSWYLTDEYRPFVLPESEANAVVEQRQLEAATGKQLEVVPYLSHGILEPEQAWDVIPYLSHGVLTASDAASGAGSSLDRPDGYQPQLGLSQSDVPLSAGIPEPGNLIVPSMPELGTFGEAASRGTNDATSAVSLRDRPDGYQPQLGGSEFGVVADEGFDWTTTGLAASIVAALLVAVAITFTRGNRHGYRSA